MTKTANERTRELILDALAYAYVRGWYAGIDGIKNDSGKIKVADELLKELVKKIEAI